ncbi:hypothetical protein QE152_g24739 [Popillia japonica]|uniref:Uncharacterized protein n=1 Tax=Popillia japonica TaxID=7064 RepID=A0AAW1K3F8_POPJA
MVERHIQTIKGLLNKSPMVRPKFVILEYNSTPKAKLPFPAEMLMGRKLRTSIPVARRVLQPSFETDKTIDILKENQKRQEDYCNPRRKQLKPLEDTQVLMWNEIRAWTPAQIVKSA